MLVHRSMIWNFLLQKLQEWSMTATFMASLVTGAMLCLVMTPFDVVCTRLYNQGIDQSTKKGKSFRRRRRIIWILPPYMIGCLIEKAKDAVSFPNF